MKKLISLIALAGTFLFVACPATPVPTPTVPEAKTKIAYIYDSVDSLAFASRATVLSAYDVTLIAHDTVTVTSASLAAYDLIIVADQENAGEYDTTLANSIINANKAVIGIGTSGSYLFHYQNVVSLPGLSTCGSGTPFPSLTAVKLSSPIWTTPKACSSSVTTSYTSTTAVFYAVTKENWPTDYASTNAIAITTSPLGGALPWAVLAREAGKCMLWGICGSIDDLNQTGKDLFTNAVYYMLHS